MKAKRSLICLLLALITVMLCCTGCAPNYEKWLLGTWEFQHDYKYAGLTDCTIVFHEENKITRTGVSEQGGNYYVQGEENNLRLLIGSGSFEAHVYKYDSQLGRQKDSGCWCMINSSRMFIDGVMYKKVSNEH